MQMKSQARKMGARRIAGLPHEFQQEAIKMCPAAGPVHPLMRQTPREACWTGLGTAEAVLMYAGLP